MRHAIVLSSICDAQTSGIWVYVTPDNGSHILWEKVIAGSLNVGGGVIVFRLRNAGQRVYGCGKIGGDAFASHFVPKAASAVVSRSYSASKSVFGCPSPNCLNRRLH